MKNKTGSIYYQLAVKNKRLDKSLLKEIMRINSMTRYSQTQFRQMFESKYTSPEVRALLLYSLFTGKPADLSRIVDKDTNALVKRPNLDIQPSVMKGESYLRLNTIKSGLATRYPLNEDQKKYIRNGRLLRDTKGYLIKAIMADNVGGQRVSLLFNEYATLLGALGYMTKMYIRLNDPEGKYVFKSDQEPGDEEASFEDISLGVHAANTKIFIGHLEHMKGELYKYTEIMGRLGIDTTGLEGYVRSILDNAKNFYTMSSQKALETFELDDEGKDLVQDMYDNHQTIINMWEEARKVGMQLDNYDFKRLTIKDVKYGEAIPRFVDYRTDKLYSHYKETAEGVGRYFADLRADLKDSQ